MREEGPVQGGIHGDERMYGRRGYTGNYHRPYYPLEHRGPAPAGISRGSIASLATVGVILFFIGVMVSNIWLFYDEPISEDYEYSEYDDYAKDRSDYNNSVRSTIGFGRIISGFGLIMLGGALFAGGISVDGIPKMVRRAMVLGGSLIVLGSMIAMMFVGIG